MTDRILAGNIAIYLADERPTDGVTLVGEAQPGSLYVDRSAGGIYINTFARNIPTWSELARGLLHQATVTLTDAEIKASPTTPVPLVAAPGANRILVPIASKLLVLFNWVASYTNVAAGANAKVHLLLGDSLTWAITPGSFTLASFLAWEADVTWQVHESEVGTSGGTANNTTGSNKQVDEALTFKIANGANGDLTGGDAANTIDVAVLYYVYDTAEQQYVHL